jgi:CRP/FNR family nitrogen fixation transcriptional regulator
LLPSATVTCQQDETIYGEGEEAKCVYKVVSGAVREQNALSGGRRQIVAFHLPGDLFGLGTGATRMLSAQAVTDTELLVVERTPAPAPCCVVHRLLTLVARDLERAQEHKVLLRKTASERVAAFLLDKEQRTQSTGAISLPMPRRDIAAYLGLTIETVSRVITLFKTKGMVTRGGRRKIQARKRSKLHAVGTGLVARQIVRSTQGQLPSSEG